MTSTSKPILGYWDMRGIVQPIRLMLVYAGVDYVDQRYSLENKSDWFNIKPSLGLDFPNLPYYIDGEFKLTQSLAIALYLAEKQQLNGKTLEERVRILLAHQQVKDFNQAFWTLVNMSNYEQAKSVYLTQDLPTHLQEMSTFLGESNNFIAGTEISYADFFLYEYLVRIKVFAPEALKRYETLVSFIERFESLPKLRSYIQQQKPSALVPKSFGKELNWYGEY